MWESFGKKSTGGLSYSPLGSILGFPPETPPPASLPLFLSFGPGFPLLFPSILSLDSPLFCTTVLRSYEIVSHSERWFLWNLELLTECKDTTGWNRDNLEYPSKLFLKENYQLNLIREITVRDVEWVPLIMDSRKLSSSKTSFPEPE